MTTQFAAFVLAVISVTALSSVPPSFTEPKSVPNLNVSELTGRWYGLYTTALTANMMNSPFCAVADVTAKDFSTSDSSSLPISDNKLTLDVNFYYNAENANGAEKHLSGLIVDEDTTADGAFILSLTTGDIPPMDGIPGQTIGRGGDILNGQLGSGIATGDHNDKLDGKDSNSGAGDGHLRDGNTFLSLSLPLYIIAAGDLEPAAPGDIAVTEASGSGGNQQDIGASSDSAQQQQYPWIVLSGPLQLNYLVLARDPERFKNEFQDRVTSLLREKNIVLPPVPLFQSKTDCNYPAVGTSPDGSLGPVVPPDMFPLPADGTDSDATGTAGSNERIVVSPAEFVQPEVEPLSGTLSPLVKGSAAGVKEASKQDAQGSATTNQPPARTTTSQEDQGDRETSEDDVVPGTIDYPNKGHDDGTKVPSSQPVAKTAPAVVTTTSNQRLAPGTPTKQHARAMDGKNDGFNKGNDANNDDLW